MSDLNEHLALKVMGWKATGGKGEVTLLGQAAILPSYYDPASCEGKGFIKDWNPSENIEQAMMCASVFAKTHEVKIILSRFGPLCQIGIGNKTIGGAQGEGKEESLIISLACARATGFKQ